MDLLTLELPLQIKDISHCPPRTPTSTWVVFFKWTVCIWGILQRFVIFLACQLSNVMPGIRTSRIKHLRGRPSLHITRYPFFFFPAGAEDEWAGFFFLNAVRTRKRLPHHLQVAPVDEVNEKATPSTGDSTITSYGGKFCCGGESQTSDVGNGWPRYSR